VLPKPPLSVCAAVEHCPEDQTDLVPFLHRLLTDVAKWHTLM